VSFIEPSLAKLMHDTGYHKITYCKRVR